MINAAQLRADYPEFADTDAYPDSGINYWLNLAGLLLNGARWGVSAADPWPDPAPALALYDVATELFVAHNITIEKKAADAAAIGAVPGESTGMVSGKSVAGVSISYDTAAAMEAGAGHWNLTVYGTRFAKLMRMAGAGPIQVGGCGGAVGAWPGVIPPIWG